MKTTESKVLVVAALGAVAERCAEAAVALGKHPGAELAFASKAALADVLEDRAGAGSGVGLVLLLGVGLSGSPERLRQVLEGLHRRRVEVVWHSAGYGFPDSLPEGARKLVAARIYSGDWTLVEELAKDFGVEASLPLAVARGDKGVGAWLERAEAAEWSFANTRGLEPLASLARDLAAGREPGAWDGAARRLVAAYRSFGYRRLVTESPAMRRLRKDIGRVARSGAMRVLVTGESGVGKETVAQQIHVQSERRGPFLAFNCATVARELIESRLFGHVRGAYTGAAADSPGLFREADGGTLFLDEIAELPPEVQGVLLRVLQEGRVQAVGSARETAVDVRVVAATNRDLAALVREGRFRADLYWRLSAVELSVPPLRERAADLRPLAKELWCALAPGRKGLSEEDFAALAGWEWPGNVRELSNVLERAALFTDRTIAEVVAEEKKRVGGVKMGEGGVAIGSDLPLDAVVRAHVREVWERHGRNLAETARVLGIARNTLKGKLE